MSSPDDEPGSSDEESKRKCLEKLISAINAGDTDSVEKSLQSKEIILEYYEDDPDNIALYTACKNNKWEIASLLLEHGADVNWGTGLPPTNQAGRHTKPIHYAVNGKGDCSDLVECLIEAQCELDVRDELGNTPLHYACLKEDPTLVRLLVEAGADVNKRKFDEKVPLMIASRVGNVEIIKILVEAGADLSQLGNESIYNCIHCNCPEGVGLLYSASKSPVYDVDGNTTRLQLMGKRKDLLEPDYPIANMRCCNEVISPFLMACSSPYAEPWEIVTTILEIGANIHQKDPLGFNCLQHACSRLNVKTVQVLLDYGVNQNDHSWEKLWKVIPPFNSHNVNCLLHSIRVTDYLDYDRLLKLLVSSGFKIDEESARKLTEAIEASGLPEKNIQSFTSFLTNNGTAPLSLKDLCRIRIRDLIPTNINTNIRQLERHIPLPLLGFLRFQDILE